MRASCANNLHQVGIGVAMYISDHDGVLPLENLPEGQNPWQTYEACRVTPGTEHVTRGFYNLGLLWRTKEIEDAKAFYCPSAKKEGDNWTYDYYATPPNKWPSTPVGKNDDNVRTSYNYFPQSRTLDTIGASRGVAGVQLPKIVWVSAQLEFGGKLTEPVPLRQPQLDPSKSISTDLVHTLQATPHHIGTGVAGLNSLFGDGHVAFQSSRANPAAFAPVLWNGPDGVAGTKDDIGDNLQNFRTVMNLWKP